ncbi:Two-component response regulator VncR [Streptococcus sp. DD10]|uniref:response regulator transcription factor n=1 Tax=Streptococcus sp. DD10 TaxID=1777878 RepID=UPI000793DBEF|nr:response regulator transcription factor [Streptococcus sp. DD10]KXT74435.1 Two-component response regulator VncR [Streptococcus sp. DD10]
MKILIVEDETIIREGISDYLNDCGYETLEATNGVEALDLFTNHPIDLVLLDIQLPKLNGLSVLEKIRQVSTVPILILTAFQDENYKMTAFSSLADGYLEKPFSLALLKIRMEAILKRYYKKQETFSYKEARVNFESYRAELNDQEVVLHAKEFEILHYLVQHEGQVLSRTQILDALWKNSQDAPFDRVVDVYIKELRKKLKLDCILTVRNVGYKLERK